MIPKKIHYCWFGGGEKSDLIKKCIKSWKLLSDNGYEIIEWNENNFDMEKYPFVVDAVKKKEWVFVADFVRAWVLYNKGGIYLDTDVMVYKLFDPFLEHEAFCCFETKFSTCIAVSGATPNHPWSKMILEYYNNKKMSDLGKEGENYLPSVDYINKIMISKFNLKANNKYQILKGIHVYPNNYFIRPSFKNNYSVHLYSADWVKNKGIKYKIINLMDKNKITSIIFWKFADFYLEKKLKNIRT